MIFATFSKPRVAKWNETIRFAVVDANPASASVVPSPSILPDKSNLIENVGNEVRQIETGAASCGPKTKKPATDFAARAL
jgi:hypothetical protein